MLNPPSRPARHGFTLVEMMVVLGILVLLMAASVPLLGLLTGKRSVAAGINEVSSALSAARANAMSQGEVRGVLFVFDLNSQRVHGIFVRVSEQQPGDDQLMADNQVDVFLDAIDTEPAVLPVGVMLQTMDNAVVDRNGRPSDKDDRYIGYNELRVPLRTGGFAKSIPVGGVVLFNSRGVAVPLRYGFRFGYWIRNDYHRTVLGDLLLADGYTRPVNSPDMQAGQGFEIAYTGLDSGNPPLAPRASMGVVVFQGDDFLPFNEPTGFAGAPQATHWTMGDTQFANPASSAPWSIPVSGGGELGEKPEEEWIDAHAVPLLINRQTGALVRGE